MYSLYHLDVRSNYLETIPYSFSDLHNLKRLSLSNNELTSFIINIDSINDLYYLDIGQNHLTFESIEPYVNKVEDFFYSPQELIGEDVYIEAVVGDPLDIYVDMGGIYNEYQWYLYDWEISGADSSHYIVDAMHEADFGDYRCVISNSLVTDLVLVSNHFYVGEGPWDIEVQGVKKDVQILPNPAKDILHLFIPTGVILKEIIFYNPNGIEVLRLTPINNKVNISELTPGLYIVKIISGNGLIVKKLIKA